MTKQDNLPISGFQNPDGSNNRQAAELSPQFMKEWAQAVGAEILEFKQLWRHGHGVAVKDGQKAFFKISSTPGIAEKTKNEASWCQQMAPLVDSSNQTFLVPEILDSGEYAGLFYYFSTMHTGPFLSAKMAAPQSRLAKWLERIAAANVFMLSLKDMEFYRDQQERSTDRFARFQKRITEWFGQVQEFDLQKIYEEALQLEQHFHPGVSHGDFVPWHMIQSGDKFALIDSEHGSGRQERYYDIAYFYHRLYTRGPAPEMAKAYLRTVIGKLAPAAAADFMDEFRAILASRIIGGFWDAKTDGDHDISWHQKIRADFLADSLV